jgi:hypothetical protein
MTLDRLAGQQDGAGKWPGRWPLGGLAPAFPDRRCPAASPSAAPSVLHRGRMQWHWGHIRSALAALLAWLGDDLTAITLLTS